MPDSANMIRLTALTPTPALTIFATLMATVLTNLLIAMILSLAPTMLVRAVYAPIFQ